MVDFTKEFNDASYIDFNNEDDDINSLNEDNDEVQDDDDEISDDELQDSDEDYGDEKSLDVEDRHLRTSNDVFSNSYLDGENLKENIHLSHKLSVEKTHEDSFFDLYDTTSIEYHAMEHAVEEAKISDDNIKAIFDMVNIPTKRPSKRKNKATGIIEDVIVEEEFKLTNESANEIFETFISFFTATIDRRKFFYVRFVTQVICNAFDFRIVTFDKTKVSDDIMKECNATVSVDKGDRIECDRFFDMLSDKNKQYIRNNYY